VTAAQSLPVIWSTRPSSAIECAPASKESGNGAYCTRAHRRIDEFDCIDVLASGMQNAPRSGPRGAILSLRGWALIKSDPARASGVFVRSKERALASAQCDLDRNSIQRGLDNLRPMEEAQ